MLDIDLSLNPLKQGFHFDKTEYTTMDDDENVLIP